MSRNILPVFAKGLFALLMLTSLGMSCGTGAGGYHTRGFQVNGIYCEHGDRLRQHHHVHLSVIAQGEPVAIPANVGLNGECVMPLHTYDASGVIHVETATERAYVLGDFFGIWRQPLARDAVMDLRADATHQVRVFVNGEPFDGEPGTIPLSNHHDIAVIYGPPFVPPAAFRFPTWEP